MELEAAWIKAANFLGTGSKDAVARLEEHLHEGTIPGACRRFTHDLSINDWSPNLDRAFWRDWRLYVDPSSGGLRCRKLTPREPGVNIDLFAQRAAVERVFGGKKAENEESDVLPERVEAKVYVPAAYKRAAEQARKTGKRRPGIIEMSHSIANKMKTEHPLDAVDFERVKRILYDEGLYERRPYRKS
jgi:hypothetical protein